MPKKNTDWKKFPELEEFRTELKKAVISYDDLIKKMKVNKERELLDAETSIKHSPYTFKTIGDSQCSLPLRKDIDWKETAETAQFREDFKKGTISFSDIKSLRKQDKDDKE